MRSALFTMGAIDLLGNSQPAHALAPFAELAAGCRDDAQDLLTRASLRNHEICD
jgi:hypothetical protein